MLSHSAREGCGTGIDRRLWTLDTGSCPTVLKYENRWRKYSQSMSNLDMFNSLLLILWVRYIYC